MNDGLVTKIEKVLSEVLGLLKVSHEGFDVKEIAGQKIVSVKTKETRTLIGINGETLGALDYVVKKMIEHQEKGVPLFSIDVDGYKTDRIQEIQQKAMIMAERAKSFQYDVEMPPMSAYERLIVHATLQNVPAVKTESQGVGKDRKLVIKYIGEA